MGPSMGCLVVNLQVYNPGKNRKDCPAFTQNLQIAGIAERSSELENNYNKDQQGTINPPTGIFERCYSPSPLIGQSKTKKPHDYSTASFRKLQLRRDRRAGSASTKTRHVAAIPRPQATIRRPTPSTSAFESAYSMPKRDGGSAATFAEGYAAPIIARRRGGLYRRSQSRCGSKDRVLDHQGDARPRDTSGLQRAALQAPPGTHHYHRSPHHASIPEPSREIRVTISHERPLRNQRLRRPHLR